MTRPDVTKADAIFTKGTGGIHIVTINFRKEHRSFRVYSQRAGLVLVQLAKAFPPFSSIAIPAEEANQCVEDTMPKLPLSSGRVVNIF